MLSAVLGFAAGRVIVPFLRRTHKFFPQVDVIMNIIRFDVLLNNKVSIINFVFLVFFGFIANFLLKSKDDSTNTNSSSLKSSLTIWKENYRK